MTKKLILAAGSNVFKHYRPISSTRTQPWGKAPTSFMKTNHSKHENYLLLFYHEEYVVFYLPVKISCSLKANLILE